MGSTPLSGTKDMTEKETELIRKLRVSLYKSNYPPVFMVDNETLEAVEQAILEHLIELGLDPILQCGKNGLWFKGCELVLPGR